MEIFRFQLPQGNRREEQMEGREENGKTSAEGRKREDGIVAIERRRKIEGKKKEKREIRHLCMNKLAARWEALLADDQSIAAST